jgi:hypothetical protein
LLIDVTKEEFKDTKGVMSIRKSKNRQHNDQKKKVQKDKQRSTKYAHESKDP